MPTARRAPTGQQPAPTNPTPLREGYLHDLATGKPVDGRKPEEAVRQEYEKILHEDYSYDYAQMDIEVFIQRGSRSTPKGPTDRADIVIYKTTDPRRRDQHSDILGIIETKRRTRKDGVKQLMSYMSASSCDWGVWTNGKNIEYVYHDKENGEIKRDFIHQIPKSGETLEDIGNITKDKLVPAQNLRPIFRRILNTLYANTNISRREKLGSEMIKLIFCKIWDERYDREQLPKFRVGFRDTNVKRRIEELFNEVKDELSRDGVFEKTERITLEEKSIIYVVGELERYALIETDKDVVGDAFEVFAESKLVGEKGEFFTPREVVKTAIKIVEPKPSETILDPACGSGGFLIYALEHVWKEMDKNPRYRNSPQLQRMKEEVAQKSFNGIDKETDLVKISKAYMAIVGDGRGGIVQENTLHAPEEWQGRAKEIFVTRNNEFKEYDIILTNPPFGSKIKVLKEEAAQFDLGYKWILRDGKWEKTSTARDTPPQILFVERCFEMLKDGGTLGIVLPETYFHAPKGRYVLDYMKQGNNIRAIIDLAHNTFRPYNNAKTLLLVLDKGVPQEQEIIMGVAEEIGHDHHRKPIYRYDYEKHAFLNEIWDDTEIIRKELDDPSNKSNQNVFTVRTRDIVNNIYVPRYYWRKRTEKILKSNEKEYDFILMQKLIEEGVIKHFSGHGSPPGKFKGKGDIPYVRVADIVNWEIYKNPVARIPRNIYENIKGKNGVTLQEGDVLFVRRGSYRIGTVAIASRFDSEVLLTREISIFRVTNPNKKYGITPFYLAYLLSHDLTQQQLYNKIMIETTLPNIGDRWKELYLPISRNKAQKEAISKEINDTFRQKWAAQEKILGMSKRFGGLTT